MGKTLLLVWPLIFWGCSSQPEAVHHAAVEPELQRMISQKVTLRGEFDLRGVMGPYIHRSGEPVYLVPHGSFVWGTDYERMQGKNVRVTGVLHFQHSKQGGTSDSVARPVDYFYFDAETAQIALE